LRKLKYFKKIIEKKLLLFYKLYRITKYNANRKKKKNLINLNKLIKILKNIYYLLIRINIKIILINYYIKLAKY